MFQYIQKQNKSGGIFRCEFNGMVEIVEVFFKVVDTVLTVCPYKDDIRGSVGLLGGIYSTYLVLGHP